MKEETIIDNVKFEGVRLNQHPKYEDAFIVSANRNGIPMTEQELDELDDDTVNDLLQKYSY